MADKNQDLLRKIPSVDALLQTKALASLAEKCPHKVITDAARSAAENIRRLIIDGAQIDLTEDNIQQTIITDIVKNVSELMTPHYRKVVNAAGILLHTALIVISDNGPPLGAVKI